MELFILYTKIAHNPCCVIIACIADLLLYLLYFIKSDLNFFSIKILSLFRASCVKSSYTHHIKRIEEIVLPDKHMYFLYFDLHHTPYNIHHLFFEYPIDAFLD